LQHLFYFIADVCTCAINTAIYFTAAFILFYFTWNHSLPHTILVQYMIGQLNHAFATFRRELSAIGRCLIPFHASNSPSTFFCHLQTHYFHEALLTYQSPPLALQIPLIRPLHTIMNLFTYLFSYHCNFSNFEHRKRSSVNLYLERCLYISLWHGLVLAIQSVHLH